MALNLSRLDLATLYDRDIVLWSEAMVDLLQQGQFDQLDLKHLIDEVKDLGRRQRDRLISSIRLILLHLLKGQYQPERRSPSWSKTIRRERLNIQTYLDDTPSLKRVLTPEWLEKTYQTARKEAAIETDLPLSQFPTQCGYTWEQVLDDSFFP
jgi:predicted DNA-binding ribbon-helix-helix protein